MMMNSEIETIFENFTVDDVSIPIEFEFYDGDADSYIVYSNSDNDSSYSGDDELLGYITYYDFEIYCTGNYFKILSNVISLMNQNGWQFEPSLSSADHYDRDTKMFNKTLCFGKHVQFIEQEENNNGNE